MRHVLATIVCVLVAMITMSAGQPQRPTFRAAVDLVQVDVVVLDRQGRPVRGLTKDDFRIMDGDVPREIALFEEVAHAHVPRPFGGVAAPDVADNHTAGGDRLVVLVIDDLHFQKVTEHVQALARLVVEGLGADASMAMIFTSFRPGVEFTQNRQVLLDAIDAFKDKVTPQGSRIHPGLQLLEPRIAAVLRNPVNSQATLQVKRALQEAARLLAPEERRRKALIWISSGIGSGLHFDPARKDDVAAIQRIGGYAPFVRSTMTEPSGGYPDYVLDELRRSNVAVFAIDPGGYGSHAMLRDYANGSGGFVVAPQDVDAGMDLVLDTLDHYYLLAFEPERPEKAGKTRTLRPLQVTATNPDLIVRSRNSYVDGPPPPLPKNNSELVNLSASVMPTGDLPLRVFAAPLPVSPRAEQRVAVVLEVEGDTHLLPPGPGETIEFAVLAIDLKKRKVTATSFQKATAIAPTSQEGSRRATHQVSAVMTLPAGRYQLRASAVSRAWGRGSVYLTTDVPNFRSDGPALGGLVVAAGPSDAVSSAAPWGSFPFKPTLARTWSSGDVLRLYVPVHARRATAPGTTTIEILDADRQVVRHTSGTTGASHAIEGILDLAALPPGDYLLRVRVNIDAAVLERTLAFRIR